MRAFEYFEACQQIDTVIDKRSLVTVATHSYSAPTRWAHHPVQVKVFVDSVELWCEHQHVATHPRNHGKGQYVLEPTHDLNLLRTKPGSLDNARPFKGMAGNPRDWPKIFAADERMTDALLDRITHHMHLVALEGDSFRLKPQNPRKSSRKKAYLSKLTDLSDAHPHRIVAWTTPDPVLFFLTQGGTRLLAHTGTHLLAQIHLCVIKSA